MCHKTEHQNEPRMGGVWRAPIGFDVSVSFFLLFRASHPLEGQRDADHQKAHLVSAVALSV